MALGSIQPLTEMSTRNRPARKALPFVVVVAIIIIIIIIIISVLRRDFCASLFM
jgi:hypothetical protein